MKFVQQLLVCVCAFMYASANAILPLPLSDNDDAVTHAALYTTCIQIST